MADRSGNQFLREIEAGEQGQEYESQQYHDDSLALDSGDLPQPLLGNPIATRFQLGRTNIFKGESRFDENRLNHLIRD